MSRRAIAILAALAVLAMTAGVAAGIVVARRGAKPVAADAPVEPPAATAAATTRAKPATSTSSTTGSSTTVTAGLTVQAKVAQRLEDGLLIRWTASAPVTAVLTWGFGAPQGHSMAIGGSGDHGTVKLPLPATTQEATFTVTGRAADGRTASSPPASGRRLVRRVVLSVAALSLDIPDGTGGVSTSFLGTTYTFGPRLDAPGAAAEPYAFPAKPLRIAVDNALLTLTLYHQVRPEPQQTGTVRLLVDFPEPGRAVTMTRNATAVGVTAHLTLKVTVSIG